MTRRIPPPKAPQTQVQTDIALQRGARPPDHDKPIWVVVDPAGNRHHGPSIWSEAWKVKEQLAGGRKVRNPRIERDRPAGAPPGVPMGLAAAPVPAAAPGSPEAPNRAVVRDTDDDIPEVAAGGLEDAELDQMIDDMNLNPIDDGAV